MAPVRLSPDPASRNYPKIGTISGKFRGSRFWIFLSQYWETPSCMTLRYYRGNLIFSGG